MPTLSKEVEEAFRTLPSRYLGAHEGFDATYHVRLGDVGHTWEIRCTPHGARVRMGATRRRPDVTIGTDAKTWLELRASLPKTMIGKLSKKELVAEEKAKRAMAKG